MKDYNCPVCETEKEQQGGCPRCGHFVLSEFIDKTVIQITQKMCTDHYTPLQRAILSHHIRKSFENIGEGKYSIEDFKNILKEYPSLPKAKEQLNNLIMYLGSNIPSPSESLQKKSKPLQAILGTLDRQGLYYVLSQASKEKFIKEKFLSNIRGEDFVSGSIDDTQQYQLSLTFKGWELYDELKTKGSNSDKVFMAMAFSREKEFMDKLYFSLKSAISLTGFELHRIDEKPEAGSIPDRIKVEILNSKFVIADITHHNNGAYWEAGFAEGLGKKVIYTCRKDVLDNKETHFDVRHLTTIPWEDDKLEQFYEAVKNTIRATFNGKGAKMEDEKEQIAA